MMGWLQTFVIPLLRLDALREILWDDASISLRCALASNVIFWPLSFLGLYADRSAETGASPRLARCKLQPGRYLCRRERFDLILLAAFNMLFVAPILCCPLFERMWDFAAGGFGGGGGGGGNERLTEADEWMWRRELLIKLPFHALVAEVAFYSVHILLHSSSFLYRRIHRVHHRFVAPTAMACVYAHPLEFALGNILPIYLGPMITDAHPWTCYALWFPLAMAGTCRGHCGYRIASFVDPHDSHHSLYRFNYGGMCLLDRMFGTSVEHLEEERNMKNP
uniref:Fatty acid hydroxylase domain-containing protein n=1 Tax=Odontella aurita TaxID=265563 RepID=A0A7S4N6A0_9STRA|mmetsp:Transcript_4914/g.13987  ORF Transcript_4914/g.13987 Transcript_4914/m.13987 type:complete len:279 (+) Transcript_4914:255-1091(+)